MQEAFKPKPILGASTKSLGQGPTALQSKKKRREKMFSFIEADHEIEKGNDILDLVVLDQSRDTPTEAHRIKTAIPWTTKSIENEMQKLRTQRNGSEHWGAYLGVQWVGTTES